MGWIRIPYLSPPAQQLHNLAARVEVDSIRLDQSKGQEASRFTSKAIGIERGVSTGRQEAGLAADHATVDSSDEKSYPIQPKSVPDSDLPFVPAAEVKKRDGKDGRRLFIVVDTLVLDCTTYITRHPGGRQIIHSFGGQDCSWQWWRFHNRKIWNDVATTLRVGRTEGIGNRFLKPEQVRGLRPLGYSEDFP